MMKSKLGLFEDDAKDQQFIQTLEDVQDPPDPIIDGCFNLGECVAEQLSLEIDPFPRSANVSFDGFSSSQGEWSNENNTSPFAALEQLKRKL